MLGLVYKDLDGSALLPVEEGELDKILPGTPEQPEQSISALDIHSTESAGWSVLHKLIFLGVIFGGVAICMKARKKSLA